MSFVAVAIGGSAVIGGVTSVIAGNKAAGAARDAAAMQAQTDQYIFDTTRADNAPWRSVGQGALGKLAKLYGVGDNTDWEAYVRADPAAMDDWRKHWAGGEGALGNKSLGEYGQFHYNLDGQRRDLKPFQSNGFDEFTASPGYQFRMDQGMKAIERSAAARGGLRSGATMKSLNDYAQGTASDEFARYTSNLANLAGIGQQANQANQQAGAQYAANSAATNANLGNARASAYANTGNAINNTVGNLAGMYLYTQGYGRTKTGLENGKR